MIAKGRLKKHSAVGYCANIINVRIEIRRGICRKQFPQQQLIGLGIASDTDSARQRRKPVSQTLSEFRSTANCLGIPTKQREYNFSDKITRPVSTIVIAFGIEHMVTVL